MKGIQEVSFRRPERKVTFVSSSADDRMLSMRIIMKKGIGGRIYQPECRF